MTRKVSRPRLALSCWLFSSRHSARVSFDRTALRYKNPSIRLYWKNSPSRNTRIKIPIKFPLYICGRPLTIPEAYDFHRLNRELYGQRLEFIDFLLKRLRLMPGLIKTDIHEIRLLGSRKML